MSDEVISEWVWQGFFGPTYDVIAAKMQIESLPANVVGVIIPPVGAGVVPVNIDGSKSMFAVQTRRESPIPTPEGLDTARPEIVGSLVAA